MKIQYNNEFKTIDTQEKAYFVGLMYSDGCVTKLPKAVTKISMVEADLIKSLHKHFPFFSYAEVDYSKYNSNCQVQQLIRSSNRTLHSDLINLGILPRKSYENCELLKVPEMDKSLIRHFIRGFFDGDGSIYDTVNRKGNYIVEMCSTSYKFINELQNILVELGLDARYRRKKKGKNQKQSLHVVYLLRNADLDFLKTYFYDDAKIYIQRKYLKFMKVENINCNEKNIQNHIVKNTEINLFCPHCNSFHVQKSGKCHVTFKQRYLCINCSKKFNISKTTLNPVNSGEVQ